MYRSCKGQGGGERPNERFIRAQVVTLLPLTLLPRLTLLLLTLRPLQSPLPPHTLAQCSQPPG